VNWENVFISPSSKEIKDLLTLSSGSIIAGTKGDGIFISDDSGDNWTKLTDDAKVNSIHSLYENDNSTIFSIDPFGGVLRSNDMGQNWESISGDLPYVSNYGVTSVDDRLFIASRGGVFQADSNDLIWSFTSNGINLVTVNEMIMTEGNEIFAATNSGVYVSSDDGSSWELRNTGLIDSRLSSIVMNSQGHLFVGSGRGVFHSSDSGQSWDQTNFIEVEAMEVNTDDDLFAGAPNGIFRSTDNGNSWENMEGEVLRTRFNEITCVGNQYVFLATSKGIFRSQDNGVTWELLENGNPSGPYFSVYYNELTGEIYAGKMYKGLYLSTDNGDSWTDYSEQVDFNSIRQFITNSLGWIFIGAYGDGVYYSKGDFSIWEKISEIFEMNEVQALLINSQGNLLAGIYDYGVFRSAIATEMSILRDSATYSNFTKLDCSPNPFNQHISITFGLNKGDFIELGIFNQRGQLVRSIAKRELAPGEHQLSWDGRDSNNNEVINGIYFYRITTNAQTAITGKVVKAR
jgi:photosystem II stability/assembly factor-like uncharacterized protein